MSCLYTNENINSLCSPCYGVIVFKLHDDKTLDECLIVQSISKKQFLKETEKLRTGFPKGSAIKNSVTSQRENIYECGFRELKEETNLSNTDVLIANGYIFHEKSNKNNIAVSYLVGKVKSNDTLNIKCSDPTELEHVGFVRIENCKQILCKNRLKILSDAYEIVTNIETNFVEINLDKPATKAASGQTLKKISKSMSYVLRHGAREIGLQMDSAARIKMSDLIAWLKIQPDMSDITFDTIRQVVNDNDKKRFEIENIDGEMMIRAVQGHSKEFSDVIDETHLMTDITEPLEKCIHGTDLSAWNIIQNEGLKCLSRMHIHFAISEPESSNVISGMRKSSRVMIYINMKLAMSDGIKFYLSKNNVILTNGIDGVLLPKYFQKVVLR